jgi:hypothetical protein
MRACRARVAGLEYSAGAMRALRGYVAQVGREQQGRVVDHSGAPRALISADGFSSSNQRKPRQPDGVSCGVCIVMIAELIAEGRFNEAPAREFLQSDIEFFRARWACKLLVGTPRELLVPRGLIFF